MTEAPTTPRPISILTVDDHSVVREGIAALLQSQPDMVVVGSASDGMEAVEKHRALRPDVTLMDMQMPEMGGLEAIMAIRNEQPSAKIVVLTTYQGDVHALRAMRAGAVGYLLKNTLRRELFDAIRAAHAGRRHLPPEIAQQIAMHAIDDPLSDREIHVLRLVADGNANKEIARQLKLSEETIKAHLRSIFGKLDVGDRTHAVTTAIRRGIIEP